MDLNPDEEESITRLKSKLNKALRFDAPRLIVESSTMDEVVDVLDRALRSAQ